MKNIQIIVKSDVDPNVVLKNLKDVGVMNTTLNGNIIMGDVSPNLINPLRSMEGVESVTSNSPDESDMKPIGDIQEKLTGTLQLSPEPKPAPQTTDAPYPTKWSGLEEK